MDTDAIHTDVSNEEEVNHPVLSERELAMQQITAQLDAGRPQPEPEEEPEPAPTPATPSTVRVKVDGEEKELPLEDVIKGYQKDTVASRRLEEAARKLREAEQREQALAERERQIAAQTAAPAVAEADGVTDEDIAAYHQALLDGDNDGAARLLITAMKKGRQPATPAPTVDIEEVVARAAERLRAEREVADQKRTFEDFAKEYPVFAEPAEGELYTPQRVRGDYLFANLYGKQWENGEISYREALVKTAEHVAQEFPTATPQNVREERKKSIDNIPVAASRAAAPAKEQSTSDVLAEMRKARGQSY